MAEDIILDFSKNLSDGISNYYTIIFVSRYFNVIGSDPKRRLGEAPRPKLREHGHLLGACFDAARGFVPRPTNAHINALEKAKASKVGIYNVGTGKVNEIDFVGNLIEVYLSGKLCMAQWTWKNIMMNFHILYIMPFCFICIYRRKQWYNGALW
ncbi:hypothetical protein UlMin_031693 [Ulmus minor]